MTTTCPRCASLMVADAPLQFHSSAIDQSERTFAPAYHCVCCGNYLDAVIVANRAKQADERRLILEAETIASNTVNTNGGHHYASTEIRRTPLFHQNAA